MIKLKDVKNEWNKYIVLADESIVDVVFCNFIGNCIIPGNPIWTMIVAPSSGGKSTILAPLAVIPQVHFIDDLTEKTFLSGFKVKGKEMSLLKSIGSGVIAFSDFTTIIAKNDTTKGEILSQLRMIYDGTFIKHTGTGKIEWRGKMGFIGASTPEIYFQLEGLKAMGERFTYYYLTPPTDDQIADKRASVGMSAQDIHMLMQPFYRDYVADFNEWLKKNGGARKLVMTDDQKARLKRAAKFCVNGKATVHLSFKSRKVDRIPNKAAVGRDYGIMSDSLWSYQMMDAYEANNYDLPLQDSRLELIEKIAYSSINRERRKILEILCEKDGEPLSASEIGTRNGLGLEKESVEEYLAPLHAVGMIQKVAGHTHKWYVGDEDIRKFVREVSKRVIDDIPMNADKPEENTYVKPEKDEWALPTPLVEDEFANVLPPPEDEF